MAKRLPGAGVIWHKNLDAKAESAPRSLLAKSPQHQGVFWPNQKTKKNPNFNSAFLGGLNIALYLNLIGSSDVDFHNNLESGIYSKITFGTKESFSQTTVELAKNHLKF